MDISRRKIIFLDMDGSCLTDWTNSVIRHFGLKDLPLELPEGLYPWFGGEDNSMRKRLNLIMETYNFWRDLEPYSYTKELVQMVEEYARGKVEF
jgi:hypothetical protein